MAVGDVWHFSRALSSQLAERIGWDEVARETIPSLPNDPVCLLEWKGEGDPTDNGGHVTAGGGLKDDDNKDRWDLLFVMLAGPLHDVLRGLQYGAKKYKENPDDPNYRRVADPRRRFGNAALRHLFSSMNGEEIDADSGVPHLALAAINCLFLRWHQMKEK